MSTYTRKNAVIIRGARPVPDDWNVVATLGMFDGVHRGHDALIDAVQKAGQRLEARQAHLSSQPFEVKRALVSFYPHPEVVFGRAREVPVIKTFHQKVRSLGERNIDLYVLLRFSPQLRNLSPREFLKHILIDRLRVAHLVVGPDARVGKDRAGTPEFIREIMASYGVSVDIVPFVLHDGQRVSSGRVRAAILAGSVEEAASLLGEPYRIEGRVVRGDGRGRGLNFPTANVHSRAQLKPARGVYACRVHVEGKSYVAVTNVGVRPTFCGRSDFIVVESHIPDYGGPDFYGARVEVEFLKRLRDEMAFPSSEALREQIARDIADTRLWCGGRERD